MDIQRIILIGALAVISYIMVLQWQKDYGAPEQPVQATTVSSHSAAPEITTTTEQLGTDIPSATSTVQQGNVSDSPVEQQASATDAGQLIRVKTDVLNLLIDPYGGDIIHAELNEYLAQLGAEQKLVVLEQNDNRSYIAQSGLTGKNGPDASGGRPRYQVSSAEFEMGDSDQLVVDLTLTQESGVKITKRFTLTRGKYQIAVDYLIENNSDQPWQASLFGQIKRDNSDDPSSQTSMGMQSYLGPAFSSTETPYNKVSFDDLDDAKYADKTQGGWVAMLQHYFVSAWVPNPETSHSYFGKARNGNYFAGFVSPALSLAAGEKGSTGATFYVGPKIQKLLEETAPNLELTVDFGWLWWIALPLFIALDMIQDVVVNWGLAIILVTLAVKALFYPLSAKAYTSMAKMRSVGPELTRLKELYGDDRQKMSAAMMELYKKEKINPLGGCLPIVIQMPVFIALYWVLLESVELRHAPFVLWIQDMSVMDPYFVLPIMMGLTMFIQQTLNPTPPDPMQAKVMKMLPIVFTFFFLWFPAGLVLYWVVNNILSILQQWMITRKIEAAGLGKK
ncbi:membrane protein insertase YidC [Motiliproteus sp. MSK22-1]|uniref:membrane protein insertase YidC n=1 Tax=Motiliproteus sp. MSK22-1 TaxID=1897630 RepID=UPI00097807E6|nr:membrane protein insertase YidC [Motiliproteus sp. MSK22-1]OMH39613.1 membrane protein insertase YidC [Motiliproteus sp. MSK22-1]